MNEISEAAKKQEDFLACYRGRQSALHHASYMRMAKVLLALRLCEQAGIGLGDKDVFDYGFGAGTFYRYCPPGSRLFGVELDEVNVAAVRKRLRQRGWTNVDLQAIDIEHWSEHPLLAKTYDVVLCSHVLEHLNDPVGFLGRIRDCLGDAGVFLGLVPINERKPDPHHVQTVDRETVEGWARASGLVVRTYLEDDPWLYWYQPLLAARSPLMRALTQGVCLGVGVPATLLGQRLWFAGSKPFQALTASRPTQAGFVLARE